jgi:WD40 repeat protein
VKNAFSIAISSKYIICSCAEGVIRLFEPVSLKYVCILPKPHPLGVDVSLITSPDMLKVADDTCYPDVTALAYDERSQRITAVYSDRSLYVWDIRDLDKVGKYRSFLFHSDCVWGIEVMILIQPPVGNDLFITKARFFFLGLPECKVRRKHNSIEFFYQFFGRWHCTYLEFGAFKHILIQYS